MLTESEISIAVQSNQGKAEYQRSLQQAAQIRALAEAEAEKAARIGIAQAIAIEEQVRAYGGPQFQVMQGVMNRFAEAIERSGVDVVPRVMVGGGGNGNGTAGGGNVFEALLTLMLSERMGEAMAISSDERNPEAEKLRQQIRQQMLQRQADLPVATPVTTPLTRPTNGNGQSVN